MEPDQCKKARSLPWLLPLILFALPAAGAVLLSCRYGGLLQQMFQILIKLVVRP